MTFGLTVALLALVLSACGSSSTDTTDAPGATTTVGAPTTTTQPTGTTAATTTTTDEGTEGPTELEIAAEDSEGFTTDRLDAPPGEITVEFNNKDVGGEPHNWHIAVNPGVEEYATIIAVGPDIQDVTFTIGVAGDYDFWCDTHSEAMRGVLTVGP